jgi:hypothetical protein
VNIKTRQSVSAIDFFAFPISSFGFYIDFNAAVSCKPVLQLDVEQLKSDVDLP